MAAGEPLILTPTARLARALARRQALQRRAEGIHAWRAPAILTFPAWQARLTADWFVDADDPRTPISTDQARELWARVIDTGVFIGQPRVAEMAESAWRLIHEHDLARPRDWPLAMLSVDAERFRDWALEFQALCARRALVDAVAFSAELPQLVSKGSLDVPARIELAGFDLPLTPLQARLLDAAAAAGAEVTGRPEPDPPDSGAIEPSGAARAFAEAAEEIVAAARWARGRLEANPQARLAVVVPDLAGRVDEAERAFRSIFDPPGFRLHDSRRAAWHISLGKPLSEWPLAADALMILGLERDRFDQPRLTRLLRSPFLAGWENESTARAAALVRLADRHPFELTFFELAGLARKQALEELGGQLARWKECRDSGPRRARPSDWTGQFQAELSALGLGSGRPLDSREYQVLGRWQEVLEAFGALDAVTEGPIGRREALARLAERARAVFRERNPGAPVEVLGVQEALGSRFDGIWIAGMDAESWPPPARREALVPGPVQASVPGATPESSLLRARQILRALLASAGEVAVSYTTGEGEEPRPLTPLLAAEAAVAQAEESPEPAPLEDAVEDARAPAAAPGRFSGGTGLLRAQSACPFKAFAEARLGAREFGLPRPGPDAGVRGSLIHTALEFFWRDCPDSEALAALDEEALRNAAAVAAEAAVSEITGKHRLLFSTRGQALEIQRLTATLLDWLELERTRPPFRVAAREEKVRIELAGLEVGGKIDRIDELDGGGRLLIDYKTGASASAGHWRPEERIRDPQLPAYALAAEAPPAGIAFARVRAEEQAFSGVAETDPGIAGIRPLVNAKGKPYYEDVDSWPELLDGWRFHLERLAGDFLAGRAEVDPARDACRYCHLHALCRIHERAAWVDGEDDDG